MFLGGDQGLGCFKFVPTWGKKIHDTKLTIEKCLGYCRERSLPVAGLYGGHDKCICNEKLIHNKHKVTDEECTDSCKGDMENTGGCGGNYRMSVYWVAEKNAKTPLL